VRIKTIELLAQCGHHSLIDAVARARTYVLERRRSARIHALAKAMRSAGVVDGHTSETMAGDLHAQLEGHRGEVVLAAARITCRRFAGTASKQQMIQRQPGDRLRDFPRRYHATCIFGKHVSSDA